MSSLVDEEVKGWLQLSDLRDVVLKAGSEPARVRLGGEPAVEGQLVGGSSGRGMAGTGGREVGRRMYLGLVSTPPGATPRRPKRMWPADAHVLHACARGRTQHAVARSQAWQARAAAWCERRPVAHAMGALLRTRVCSHLLDVRKASVLDEPVHIVRVDSHKSLAFAEVQALGDGIDGAEQCGRAACLLPGREAPGGRRAVVLPQGAASAVPGALLVY